ncbi:MAG TPA: hypothetical protein VGG28_16020 [Kofleriaceae bacterium]
MLFARLLRSGIVAIAALYLYVFPYFPRIHSANELPRVYLVKAIVDDHTFAIDRQVERFGATSDLAKRDDHFYQNKAPGASLVVVPFYAALEAIAGEPSLAVTMWLCRIVTGVIPTLVFLLLLWRFLARFAPDEATRRLVLVAYALGSLALPYSLLYYSHQLSAVLIASAWIIGLDVADKTRGMRAMIAVGLLAGCAPLVDYQAAFAGIPLLAHLIWTMRAWPRRESARALGIAALAAAVPLALLLYYHAACFGSPLSTGYNFATVYATDHDHGLLGMTHPTLAALFGVTVAPDNGFFALAPWWLIAIVGGVALWRRDRALVIACTAVAVIFFAFIASLGFWRAGWEVGPRYITAMQPFLLPLVAAGLVRLRGTWLGVACGLILTGAVIYVLACATMPYWPDSFRDPLYDVAFRLLGDHAVAPNLGRVLGLHGLVGIAPFVVGALGLVGYAIFKLGGARACAISAAITAVLIAAFALVPHAGADARAAYARTLYPAARE